MIVEELVNLTPSALIELFELDVSQLPNAGPLPFDDPATWDGKYRFYNYGMNELEDSLVWDGNVYQPFPIDVDGFSKEGDKQTPRPTLTISNLSSLIQELVYKYEDILGGKVTRVRTFAKYLDAANFASGNTEADPTQSLPDTVYYIRKKLSENIDSISFELSSPWDVEGLKLPRRVMTSNVCYWKYRGSPCNYIGPGFTILNEPTLDNTKDVCNKKLSGCLQRFPRGVEVPFGGFPALSSG